MTPRGPSASADRGIVGGCPPGQCLSGVSPIPLDAVHMPLALDYKILDALGAPGRPRGTTARFKGDVEQEAHEA
jgi:hypothetical protein